MHPSQGQRFTRLLILDFVLRNLIALAFVFVVLAAFLVWDTNDPVSGKIIEGRFVSWMVYTAPRGQQSIQVFVDLPDGRRTAVVAWEGWQPPEIGSVIRLGETTHRWFGATYYLPPDGGLG